MFARQTLAVMLAVLALAPPCLSAQMEQEWIGGQWRPVPPAQPGTPEGDLALIRQLSDEGKFALVVSRADKFLKTYGDAPQREEVLMLAGQAQFNCGLYWQAFEYYEKQLQQYPAGVYAERALAREYAIGDAFLIGKKRRVLGILWLGAYDDGIDILNRIAEQAPGSAIAERALMRVAEYYFARRDYEESAAAYDRYLSLFSKSSQTGPAMLQAARAMLLAYRGAEYDPTPLIDSRERFTAFAQRFPVEARRQNVPQIFDQIADDLAQQDCHTAAFYERTRHPQAAAFYYRQVIKRYPDTQWASQARSRLESLGLPVEAPPLPRPSQGTSRPAEAPASAPAASPSPSEGGPLELERLVPPGPAPTSQEGTP